MPDKVYQRRHAELVPAGVKIRQRKLKDYTLDPANPNKGTERGGYIIGSSVEQFGPMRSGVADQTDTIRAGNHTADELSAAGIEDVIEVETTGKQWVVVKRPDITPEQGKAYAVADNRSTEVGLSWDSDVLKSFQDSGEVDLSQFWHEDELAALFGSETNGAGDPGAQVDKAGELQSKWQVKPGDLWQIGHHRLLCGDSTRAEDVARVMGGEKASLTLTDPMYDISQKDFVAFWGSAKAHSETIIAMGFGYECSQFAEWVGAWNYDYVYEVNEGLFFAHKPIQRHKLIVVWATDTTFYDKEAHYREESATSIIRAPLRPPRSEVEFAYAKPVSLFALFCRINAPREGVVLDPFLGSGTTLIACEETGRTCRGIEIDPPTCSVGLQRFSEMGMSPCRV